MKLRPGGTQLNSLLSLLAVCIAAVAAAGWIQTEADSKKEITGSPSQEQPAPGPTPAEKAESTEGGTYTPIPTTQAGQNSNPPILIDAIRLLREHSFQADIRQRAYFFGKEIDSRGTYLQADGGKGGVRIELEIRTKNRLVELKSINDGVYYFRQLRLISKPLEFELRKNQKSLESKYRTERINLRKVDSRILEQATFDGQWLSFGGLHNFMDQLDRCFQFSMPEAVELSGQQVLRIRGKWKASKLANLFTSQKTTILNDRTIDLKSIPPQLPLEVEVHFLAEGKNIGFPCRIVFFRPSDELLEDNETVPVLVTEFHQVARIETPAVERFQFNAEADEVFDVTDEFIQALSTR